MNQAEQCASRIHANDRNYWLYRGIILKLRVSGMNDSKIIAIYRLFRNGTLGVAGYPCCSTAVNILVTYTRINEILLMKMSLRKLLIV